MGTGSFAYRLVYLVHLLCVVVGFGTTFVAPLLAAKARQRPPAEAYAINHTFSEVAHILATPFIIAAGVFGTILVALSDRTWTYSQTWVSIAFVLFFVALGISLGLHLPNLKAMDGLQEKLATGQATPTPGGPPAEVAELQARGKRAQMLGGILHLLFLLLMIDMIWKPGL